MGFNFGFVSAGNMGSDQKMQYTVMGDAVNVGARFMPANIIYNTKTITGGATYYKIEEYVELRKLDKLLLKGKTKPTIIYELLGWKKDKYFEVLGHQPIPNSLLTRWKFAPPEKVFGYYLFYKNLEIENKLLKEIISFFENQLLLNGGLIEIKNKIEFINLYNDINKICEKYEIDFIFDNSSYINVFEKWDKEIIEKLFSILKENNNIEDYQTVLILKNRINIMLDKIKNLKEFDEIIIISIDKFKEFIESKNNDFNLEELELLNNKNSKIYQKNVDLFFNSLKNRFDEYRVMMSEIGSISEKLTKVKNLYENAIELYWIRKWDEAEEGFKKCLEIIPNDEPSKCILERIKEYRINPPKQGWQGEFIQTKK